MCDVEMTVCGQCCSAESSGCVKLLHKPTKSTGADSEVAKMNIVQIEFLVCEHFSKALEAILKFHVYLTKLK